MSTRFRRVILWLAFVFGIVCLGWGLATAFALIRTSSSEADAPYIDSPSLLEFLGIDGIRVRWPRFAIAVAGGLVLWILFRVISRKNHEAN